MRALVTGARGFVGGHLVEHLVAAGDEVVTTDRTDGGPDICDGPGIAATVREATPDVVYHLAGQADVAASWRDPAGTLRINAEGTLHVLAAAAEAGVDRVVVVSSAEVYGVVPPEAMPITEGHPLSPASPYAASKAAAEMICIAWANRGLGVIRARAFNHLGPGQSEAFVAPAIAGRLIRAGLAGDDHILVGNLDARRDFTDVRDVVAAYRLLALSGHAGVAYNVCSGEHHSIAEVVTRLLAMTGLAIELRPDPALTRPSDLPLLVGDAGLLREHTGWAPTVPLDTTLRDVLDAATLAATTSPPAEES